MKSSKKYILVGSVILIDLLLVLAIAIILVIYNDLSKYKEENYLEEKNNTIIASGMDGYVFKINDNVLFHTLDENIEIMKTDLTFNKDYSDLIANSETIFSFKNPKESYYLVKDKKFYIRNKSVNKYIDLETLKVQDFTDSVKGNWVVFQES